MKPSLGFWGYRRAVWKISLRQRYLRFYLRFLFPLRNPAVPRQGDKLFKLISSPEKKNTRLILMFGRYWNKPLEETLKGVVVPEGWEVTNDRSRMEKAAAVVFHVPEIRSLRGLSHLPGQLWVGCSQESRVHRPYQTFWDRFDLTMTFRRDADVFFGYLPELHKLQAQPAPKAERANVSFFASNWLEYSGRTRYVAGLMRYLEVHSYGKCLNNCPLSNDRGEKTKLEIIARYKFNLAFENAIEEDYVTEKFFEPLIAGTVPVYLGAPNVEEFAPGDCCYIDVRKFPDPRDLAEYLSFLAGNDAAYGEFLAWRSRPLRPAFRKLAERAGRNPFSLLFQKIQERKSGSACPGGSPEIFHG